MSRDAKFDPLETRLRAVLIDLRPTEGAPAMLRSRVDGLPERIGAGGVGARLRALVTPPRTLATMAVFAVVVVAAISLKPLIGPAIVGGGSPSATSFDPNVEGAGLVRNPIPTLLIVQVLAVLLAVALARRWRSIGGFDSWRDVARGLTLVLLVAGSGLALLPAIGDVGGSCCTDLGYGLQVYPAPGLDGPEVYYETAEPGAPVIAFFDITNVSAVPVTLEGIVRNVAATSDGPRWTAIAVATSRLVYPNDMSKLRTFAPQVIPPGEAYTLYLVGKAGQCAFGPGFTLDTPGVTGYASVSRDVELEYSMFGLSTTTTVQMPMQLVEPTGPRCP